MIKALDRNGKEIERTRVTKLLAFRGLARVPVARVEAGDLVAIAGLPQATVADTLCDVQCRDTHSGAARSIRRPWRSRWR